MWTPKRIVLLVLGFSLFFTGYFTYSFVLGAIRTFTRHELVDGRFVSPFGMCIRAARHLTTPGQR